jgi:hypothetical protein
MTETLDGQIPHFERSRWRDWCVARSHPGTTFNPLMGKTWCACGEFITDGDTATHDLCCGGFLGEGWYQPTKDAELPESA